MPSQTKLSEFIGATFGSVWTLEVLLLLAGEPDRSWTEVELVESLRGSQLIVHRAIEELMAAGLILIDEEGRSCFRPVDPQLGEMVGKVRDLYARSPDKVRRMIVSARSGGLTAFADAFRIRKD